MERKFGTEVVLLYLLLQGKINSTYIIQPFFSYSQRLMIRNCAVSIGVLISKHNQMSPLSRFEIDCLHISCSSEALLRHFSILSCCLPYSCISFSITYFKAALSNILFLMLYWVCVRQRYAVWKIINCCQIYHLS